MQNLARKLGLNPGGNKAALEQSLRQHLVSNPNIRLETLEDVEFEPGNFGYMMVEGVLRTCRIQQVLQNGGLRVTLPRRNEEESGNETDTEDEDEETFEILVSQFQKSVTKGDRKPLRQASLQDVRIATWISKPNVKDWIPLQIPLANNHERHSCLVRQMYHATSPVPVPLSPIQLLQCGWKKINPNMEISDTNFTYNFGNGASEL